MEEVVMSIDIAPRRPEPSFAKAETKISEVDTSRGSAEVANPRRSEHPKRAAVVEKKTISPRAEIRDRIKNTLENYPGIKNADEQIRRKAEEGKQKLRQAESEYWAWQKQMKAQATARWAMPPDSLCGEDARKRQDEYILERVEKAQKSMAETAANYKAWVK